MVDRSILWTTCRSIPANYAAPTQVIVDDEKHDARATLPSHEDCAKKDSTCNALADEIPPVATYRDAAVRRRSGGLRATSCSA